jgi:hypothetical protein
MRVDMFLTVKHSYDIAYSSSHTSVWDPSAHKTLQASKAFGVGN